MTNEPDSQENGRTTDSGTLENGETRREETMIENVGFNLGIYAGIVTGVSIATKIAGSEIPYESALGAGAFITSMITGGFAGYYVANRLENRADKVNIQRKKSSSKLEDI